MAGGPGGIAHVLRNPGCNRYFLLGGLEAVSAARSRTQADLNCLDFAESGGRRAMARAASSGLSGCRSWRACEQSGAAFLTQYRLPKHSRTKSPKTKNRASDDDRTEERPNENFEPSAVFHLIPQKVSSNAAEHGTDYRGNL
jgi:hypothetical protein